MSHNKTNYGTRQGDFWGQEKMRLSHEEVEYGTEKVTFWNKRSWLMVMTRQILGLNEVIFFGTGEVNFGFLWDELWDIIKCFLWTGEVDIWVVTRWNMGHIDVTFWDSRRSWYWDITRWIMGQNEVTYWDNGRWY